MCFSFIIKRAGARRRSRLQLLPRVVTDDLRALDLEKGGGGLFDSVGETARALLGGSRQADTEVEQQMEALAQSRVDAVESWLVERGGLDPERVERGEWDRRVHDGDPGVMLRLQSRER